MPTAARKSSKTPATPAVRKSRPPERTAAFESLRGILSEFAPLFVVITDTDERYSLVTKGHVWRGGPMFFAEVRLGKVYASYHLMALYIDTSLQAVSPELAKRKQGKTCFNFKKEVPPELLAELRDLTERGITAYNEKYPGWDATPTAS